MTNITEVETTLFLCIASSTLPFGVSIAEVQNLVRTAIGGENIGMVVDGRERFPINLRYPRGYRDSLDALIASRVTTPTGMQVPLGEFAHASITDGPPKSKARTDDWSVMCMSTSKAVTWAATSLRRRRRCQNPSICRQAMRSNGPASLCTCNMPGKG